MQSATLRHQKDGTNYLWEEETMSHKDYFWFLNKYVKKKSNIWKSFVFTTN